MEYIQLEEDFSPNYIESKIGHLESRTKCLTIEIKENKGWVVFGIFPGNTEIENNPSYSYESKIYSLPENIGRLKKLKTLNISFLGLTGLPDKFTKLQNLHTLDISFNPIDIREELEKLKSLKNLKELRIYGCKFTSNELIELSENKGLNIKYSREQCLDEISRK